MKAYSLSHLSDKTLLHDLAALVAQDRGTTATMLAHIAEVDARKLYLPAAYPSMYLYCVHELRLCEQAAFKRIRAGRAARRFPAIFEAVACGRLNLSAVVLLAPYLTEETADELLAAATHKTNADVEQLLAERFPRPDLPTLVQAIPSTLPAGQLSARTVGKATEQLSARTVGTADGQVAPGRPEALTKQPAPGQVEAPRPRVAPLSPERFGLQLTIGQSTHDKLRHSQALLGHLVPAGDLAQVLDRALDALIRELEKRKFAATDMPRPGRRCSTASRHIPADVKRAVRKRDGGQCTFVSETGHRCPAREDLEYDHVDPVARGGRASVGRMRLRCRAHNQYEAERVFGTGFMDEKRRSAQRAAAARREATARTEAAVSMETAGASAAQQLAAAQACAAAVREVAAMAQT